MENPCLEVGFIDLINAMIINGIIASTYYEHGTFEGLMNFF